MANMESSGRLKRTRAKQREGRADKTVHLHYATWKSLLARRAIEERPITDIMDDALNEYLAKRTKLEIRPPRVQNDGRAGRPTANG